MAATIHSARGGLGRADPLASRQTLIGPMRRASGAALGTDASWHRLAVPEAVLAEQRDRLRGNLGHYRTLRHVIGDVGPYGGPSTTFVVVPLERTVSPLATKSGNWSAGKLERMLDATAAMSSKVHR